MSANSKAIEQMEAVRLLGNELPNLVVLQQRRKEAIAQVKEIQLRVEQLNEEYKPAARAASVADNAYRAAVADAFGLSRNSVSAE